MNIVIVLARPKGGCGPAPDGTLGVKTGLRFLDRVSKQESPPCAEGEPSAYPWRRSTRTPPRRWPAGAGSNAYGRSANVANLSGRRVRVRHARCAADESTALLYRRGRADFAATVFATAVRTQRWAPILLKWGKAGNRSETKDVSRATIRRPLEASRSRSVKGSGA